jgi:hypothetical protein
MRYAIAHRDHRGELHQLTGYWEAPSPEHALEQMLLESNADDDGHWEVFAIGDA